jgi:hypothetical protein
VNMLHGAADLQRTIDRTRQPRVRAPLIRPITVRVNEAKTRGPATMIYLTSKLLDSADAGLITSRVGRGDSKAFRVLKVRQKRVPGPPLPRGRVSAGRPSG